MHTHHANVHRVTVGHNACGHQGVGGRDLCLVQQITQRLAGGCAAHAAAKVDQRALGRIDKIRCPLDLLCVEGGNGADGLRLLGVNSHTAAVTSLGISTSTGPLRPLCAIRKAERMVSASSSTRRTVKLCLVMGIVMPSM